jgi:ABC-2 type transport system permease protein
MIGVRRLALIAWREYLSYVRTVGFWLSMALMPIGLTLGATLPGLMERAAPQQTLAIIDLTGLDYGPRLAAALRERDQRATVTAMRLAAVVGGDPSDGAAVEAAYDEGGLAAAQGTFRQRNPRAASTFAPPTSPILLVPPPPETTRASTPEAVEAALQPYLADQLKLPSGGRLTAAAVIRSSATGAPALDFWTSDLTDNAAEARVSSALERLAREDRLRLLGVEPAQLAAVDDRPLDIRSLSPKAAAGEVSLRDRLPAIVGFALGLLLWSIVLTGAGILLNSVIEEKSSRILEVLLASASTTEIMGGKIVGAALVTLTVTGVWALLGGALLFNGAPGLARDLGAVLIGQGMLGYFALYLVGGYIMYAAIFAAIGASCETAREAQTLLGPVMVLLTVPVLFMTLALQNPDADILRALSWIPLFTPFIMAARAGGDPAWWEVAGTAAVMLVTIAGVLWLSGKAFRAGALSTVKLDPLAFFRNRSRRR